MNDNRILIISTDRNVFQAGSDVRTRLIEYSKNFGEVHIIVFGIRNDKETFYRRPVASDDVVMNEDVISPNCWAYSTRSSMKALYPFDAIRLGRFVIEKRGITDITCQDASLTAMAGVKLKKEYGIPLEIQLHGDIGSQNFTFSFINKIRKIMAIHYIHEADSIRVVSNRIKDYLTNILKIDESRISVRPVAVDIEQIKNAPITVDLHEKYSQFENIVLMASRFEKEKNIELAIYSWSKVVEKMPKAGLIIVGSGSQLEKLNKVARRQKIEGNVVFEPWVDKQTLASYYKTADVFLNTSLFEGYGMTLVEAKAAGCRIISTDVGVAREVGAVIVDFAVESVKDAIYSILNK